MLASEFVSKALALTGYKLDSIIELSGGLEVDWLEFKAAIKAQNPDEAASSNDADFIFNLIKAFVSMANGSGGVVVLGISDDGVAVGLEKSGFDGDKDRFTRYFSDKVLLREGWRTQNSGRWYCSGLIKPDTFLGGNITTMKEVFNDKHTTIVYNRL